MALALNNLKRVDMPLNKETNQPNETVDSEAVLENIESNWMSHTRRVSGKPVSHNSVWFVTFTGAAKVSKVAEIWHMLTEYCKTFDARYDTQVDHLYW